MSHRFDRLKVFGVYDNYHMRTLVTAILLAFDINHIDETANAEDTREMLRLRKCDIVFLDPVNEGMSGLKFTERVGTASDSPNPFVPIIMLTGHMQSDKVQAARDPGANEFLAKPVSAKAVLSRLVSVIERPRPFVRTWFYFGPCGRRRRPGDYTGPERRVDEHTAAAGVVTLDMNAAARAEKALSELKEEFVDRIHDEVSKLIAARRV